MKIKTTSLLLAIAAIAPTTSHAAVSAGSDFADNAAYDSGWTNGTDGGTADTFGAWSLTTGGGDSGHFIGSSTSLGSPGGDINTSGESFGMFGHSGQTSEAFRDFNGNTLGVGQTFSLDLAVNFRNGNKGFDLRDSTDAVIFNFNVGADDYTVNNATTGSGSIGATYSADSVFSLSFDQTTAGGGTWSITRTGGVSDFDTGTYTGVAENFKFYVSNTDNGDAANNMFANNLTVIPEPSAALLGGIGALLLLRRRR